jgi:hypothetical protein
LREQASELTSALTPFAEQAAVLLLESGCVEAWVEGAIFPSEMAFLLAVCEAERLEAVVESGRQDGYSTEILGRWAARRAAQIVSIDLETDAEKARRCRERLKSLPLALVKGNAYAEIPAAVRRLRGTPTAILLDGPKGWPAVSIVAASLEPHVSMVAFHNFSVETPQRRWFASLGGRFYEDVIPDPGPNWDELRRREIAHVSRLGGVRSLERSSLGILVLDPERAMRMRKGWGSHFGLHQPAVVRHMWHVAGLSLTPKLYGLSYRLLGR